MRLLLTGLLTIVTLQQYASADTSNSDRVERRLIISKAMQNLRIESAERFNAKYPVQVLLTFDLPGEMGPFQIETHIRSSAFTARQLERIPKITMHTGSRTENRLYATNELLKTEIVEREVPVKVVDQVNSFYCASSISSNLKFDQKCEDLIIYKDEVRKVLVLEISPR